MGLSNNPEKRIKQIDKKIRDHMDKNMISGSDGLVYNEEKDQVEYDAATDSRSEPTKPNNTPVTPPSPGG